MPKTSIISEKSKFAIKTALSLTLAYMLPMALGWPQPQTAATTVMLIAATGMVSESLQKGVLRILGTIVGATIGLTLIALFPQDRMLYLLSVSIAVALLLYLYNAYQGDSTLFMLAAVVTMMVFNGGNAEGAFLFGVDRTLLTAFGVIIYTLVGSLLWPVRVADNTEALAALTSSSQFEAFSTLISSASRPEDTSGIINKMLDSNNSFQSHYVSMRNEAEQLRAFQKEWDTIATCFEQLDEILLPALQSASLQHAQYKKYILNYDAVLDHIHAMFQRSLTHRDKNGTPPPLNILELDYSIGSLKEESPLIVAKIVSRADVLTKLQRVLRQLSRATHSLLFDGGNFHGGEEFRGKPSFVWLDLENLKTSIRVFTTFWIATALWIQFNPPGGFMFVTLSTALVVLVSYTALAPKLLYILFSLGFFFAVPAYIFLLPQMTHWYELAIFLFSYAFIGFYVFSGPVSIFFMLGLMTLGIQNTMNYHFDAILLTMLLLYMVCCSLVIAVYFPFTNKPQRLIGSFRRRFFRNCAKILTEQSRNRYASGKILSVRLTMADSLVAKIRQWGSMIDSQYFSENSTQNITAFGHSCSALLEQLKILNQKRSTYASNPLIVEVQDSLDTSLLIRMCSMLGTIDNDEKSAQSFNRAEQEVTLLAARLDSLLGKDYLQQHDTSDLAEFYLYINLQASIVAGIISCRASLNNLDWNQMQGTKF